MTSRAEYVVENLYNRMSNALYSNGTYFYQYRADNLYRMNKRGECDLSKHTTITEPHGSFLTPTGQALKLSLPRWYENHKDELDGWLWSNKMVDLLGINSVYNSASPGNSIWSFPILCVWQISLAAGVSCFNTRQLAFIADNWDKDLETFNIERWGLALSARHFAVPFRDCNGPEIKRLLYNFLLKMNGLEPAAPPQPVAEVPF